MTIYNLRTYLCSLLFFASSAIHANTNTSIRIIAPTKTSNSTISDTQIVVRGSIGVLSTNISTRSDNTAGVSNLNCSQTSRTRVDCTLDITSSGDLKIQAVDQQGITKNKNENGYLISRNNRGFIRIDAPTKKSSSIITDTKFYAVSSAGILKSNVSTRSDNTAGVSNLNCRQTSRTRVDCSVHITSSGDLKIRAVDQAGVTKNKNEGGYLITAAAPVEYDEIVCGRPNIDSGAESGPWLYLDCASSAPTWHLLAAGGGDFRKTNGSLESVKEIVKFDTTQLSPSNDSIERVSNKVIGFNLNTWNAGLDEFVFEVQANSTPCFDVYGIDPGDLKLGKNQRPASQLPLNLENLTSCRPKAPTDALSFLVIIADDQNFNMTWVMKELQGKLTSRSIEFKNAFITTPLCCPARASILSGGFYPHNTGVTQTHGDNGGDRKFRGVWDRDTLATALQSIGYKTAFTGGKYLNAYGPPYVPPGWDLFVNNDRGASSSPEAWFDYTVTEGSAGRTSGSGETKRVSQYVTDYHRDRLLGFFDDLDNDQPFLAFYSVFAPHTPAIPHPRDDVPGITIDGIDLDSYVYRGRSFYETDLSDKPDWVSNPSRFRALKHGLTGETDNADEFHRDQLRSLLSVDRAIGDLIDKLEKLNRTEKTVVIFLSDNGHLWGEHGLHKKGMAYEESVRVPFIMHVPGVTPRAESAIVSANLDLGATIFDLAGINKESEGLSLRPLIQDQSTPWRSSLQFQGWGAHEGANGTWTAIRTDKWKYIENAIGEKELYDLSQDEFEEESQHNNPSHTQTLQELSALAEEELGLAPIVFKFPDGKVSKSYNTRLKAWGGKTPYSWTIYEGKLPPGLNLNSRTGVISGTPTRAGTFRFKTLLSDSSVRPKSGDPQSYIGRGVQNDNFYTIIIK